MTQPTVTRANVLSLSRSSIMQTVQVDRIIVSALCTLTIVQLDVIEIGLWTVLIAPVVC